jgi:hypothetical protein
LDDKRSCFEWRELKEVKTIKIAICRKFKRNLKGDEPDQKHRGQEGKEVTEVRDESREKKKYGTQEAKGCFQDTSC